MAAGNQPDEGTVRQLDEAQVAEAEHSLQVNEAERRELIGRVVGNPGNAQEAEGRGVVEEEERSEILEILARERWQCEASEMVNGGVTSVRRPPMSSH